MLKRMYIALNFEDKNTQNFPSLSFNFKESAHYDEIEMRENSEFIKLSENETVN